jgi:hypothetical protein
VIYRSYPTRADALEHQSSARLRIHVSTAAMTLVAGIALLAGNLPAQEKVNAPGLLSPLSIQAQTACETEMLREMGAHEVFSGKGYEVLTEVARAYGHAIPHIYIYYCLLYLSRKYEHGSDSEAQGCNDYVLRNPQMEANADALAARTLGRRPVKAFLERVLALTEGQNWDAKRRLQVLQ